MTMKSIIEEKIDDIFSEDEKALIWAALCAYDIGKKEDNPEIYDELRERLEDLIWAFE